MTEHIRVRFACGHGQDVASNVLDAPECVVCGERRVAHVTAPAPRFRGLAEGPCAQFEELPAKRVPMAPEGSLPLKVPRTV